MKVAVGDGTCNLHVLQSNELGQDYTVVMKSMKLHVQVRGNGSLYVLCYVCQYTRLASGEVLATDYLIAETKLNPSILSQAHINALRRDPLLFFACYILHEPSLSRV
jgi:hypothetical protein